MGDLRQTTLKNELSKELELARKFESEGKIQEASMHYLKASSLSKLLGYTENAQKYGAPGSPNKNISEGKEIVSSVESLIVIQKPDTKWDDIGNLVEAKTAIKEAIILPFIKEKPAFVNSTRTILLYGPPGTGKTLLAKAASRTLDSAFFEAEAPSLLSKYYGESSKLFSALFSKAREKQPSIIFMDEIESIALSRDSDIHEATRRVVGQLLAELDGFSTKKEDDIIFIGATNRPWDLDNALLSRFQRKIFVPLPDLDARKSIFQIHINGVGLEGISFEGLSARTENFSGRDISNVCKEAIIGMVREQNPGMHELASKDLENYSLKYRKLTGGDFELAFQKIKKPITVQDLEKFEKWKEQFGG